MVFRLVAADSSSGFCFRYKHSFYSIRHRIPDISRPCRMAHTSSGRAVDHAIGIGTVVVGNVILATMPTQQPYWPQVFPAILLSSFCPDLVYVAAQLIASNSVGRRHQGIAGSLIGTLNLYRNNLGLGFAGTIEVEVSGHGADLVSGYRGALYFGVAIGIVGLLLNFACVKMPKDEREGWDETLETEEMSESTVSATAVDRGG